MTINNKNNITEIGPRPFGGDPNIKPELEVGDFVFVKWADGNSYKGLIRDKLRKNWGVEIQDEDWKHKSVHASVPDFALIRRVY
jgi:hypothetical protein|tara:strand:+ start:1078 stop:1329 length:252 start_codon:yes stop_codon:yes gene_type:complete